MYAYAFVTTCASFTRKRLPHVRSWLTWPVHILLRTHFWQAGQTYSKLWLFLVAFASFATSVTFSVAQAFFCCLQLISASVSGVLSVPWSSFRCFARGGASCAWVLSCSFFRFRSAVAAQPFAGRTTFSCLPRTSAGPSVVISVASSCLCCVALGSASFVSPQSCSLLRFLVAIAAQTSAMARAIFSCAALTVTFACVAATRCTALLMLPRGMGHFQQLLQTRSPLYDRCCASHASKAHAACFTWHMLHLHHPHALLEQSKHTLPPWRARFHVAAENFFSSLRVLQTLHTCVCSHVVQIR